MTSGAEHQHQPHDPHEPHGDDLLAVALGAMAPIPVAILLTALPGGRPDSAVTALVLVAVVVVAAAAGGRRAGAATAVTAGLAFNFFHTEPYLSLRIHSANDIVTFALLIAVGLLVGQVAGRAERRKVRVDEQRSEIRAVHRLAESLASGTPADSLRTQAERQLVEHLDLASCTWHEGEPGIVTRVGRAGTLDLAHYRHTPHGFEIPSDGLALVVSRAGHDIGWFHLVGRPGVGVGKEQWLVAVTIADLLGAAPAQDGSSKR